MSKTNKRGLLTVTALAAMAALGATPAHAQDDSYFYLGGGIGQGRAHIDDTQIANTLAGSGLTVTGFGNEERHTAYRVFGGYQFNRYVGAELGYFHFGRFGVNATTTPAGNYHADFRAQGANLDLVGTLPFTENFSGLARVGVQVARTLDTISGSGAVVVTNTTPSDRQSNVKIGLGLQYAFSPGFLLRGEVERFRLSDALGNHPQVATYMIGAVFPIGRSAMSGRRAGMTPAVYQPVAQAPTPAPVMAAPAPAPMAQPAVVVAAAPMAAPAPRRVSYAAESFFVFDRSELQPAGRQALDTFVQQIKGANFDAITVQGYADRLGTTAYNQTLSLARAEAVKTYLVSTGSLDASKIVTAGRSESDPVTLPDACKGPASASVIACLQPDRRVELEVTGWR